MLERTTENPTPEILNTYRLPSILDVLKNQVAFPFKEEEIWAEGFNDLRFVKGDNINVIKTSEKEKTFFQITIPENPSLAQIIEATREFIEKAGILTESNSFSRALIFCRELRNSARVLAEIARKFQGQKREEALTFINSLYQLGEGLEKKIKGEDISQLTSLSLDDERLNYYELPSQETDLEGYKNNLLLFLLGKNYQSFAQANQQNPKLSQIVEHSTYYSWFNRFIERKKRQLERKIKSGQEIKDEDKMPETYGEQIGDFDRYLLANKEELFSHLFPFIPESLQEGGRGHTAFWEIVTHNVFSLLDQAIEEEGWQKAKESLKSPPLFANLSEEVQERLKQLGLIDDLALNFNKIRSLICRFFPQITIVSSRIKEGQKAERQPYGKTSLFQLAQMILEKDKQLPTKRKIRILWELVQAYKYKGTYLLTSAVEEQAFECNLRSYILGRLLQELMRNEVEVYTVTQKRHVLLLVVDKSSNQGYWVDPTRRRFFYDKNFYDKNKRINWSKEPFVNPVNTDEWSLIQQQIRASPDNFHIFGYFTIFGKSKFATILPFRQGIEAGFWNNFGGLKFKEFYKVKDQNRIDLIKESYYCVKKALELNPNNTFFHYCLASAYTQIVLAEAMIREKYGITNQEPLTEDQRLEVENQYYKNINEIFQHMKMIYNVDPDNGVEYFLFLLTEIPDNKARQVFETLTPQAKQLILEIYKIYQQKYQKTFLGKYFLIFIKYFPIFIFKPIQFLRLIKQWIDDQNKNKNQP